MTSLMNKKGTTMTGIIIIILTTMALFYGMFNYVNSNYESAGVTDTLGYNESYSEIQTSQDNLEADVDSIKASVDGIAEADANIALVAWNGVTGIAGVIGLFINILDVAVNVFDAILPALSFFPGWVKALMSIGLVATIILLILGAYKGEAKS